MSMFTDKTRLEHKRGEKGRAASRSTPLPAPKGLDVSSDDLYILIDTDELRYLLEVCAFPLYYCPHPYATTVTKLQ